MNEAVVAAPPVCRHCDVPIEICDVCHALYCVWCDQLPYACCPECAQHPDACLCHEPGGDSDFDST